MRQVQSRRAANQRDPSNRDRLRRDHAANRPPAISVPPQRSSTPASATDRAKDPVDAYAAWASVLGEHFFGPDQSGRTVAMFVDDTLARELGASPTLDGVTLESAVRRELGRAGNLFGRILVRCGQWRRGSQATPPPSLPLLGATVLAATRMHNDGTYSANNFYARAAQVLGRDSRVIEDEFELVAAMWEYLDTWLRSQGDMRGISTILPHPQWVKIGYSLSQALLRDVDRRCFPQFFQWAGVAPHAEVQAESLIRPLRLWSQGHPGVSPRLRQLIENESGQELLGRLLIAEARSWDGVVADERSGVRQLQLRLVVQPSTKSVRWAAEGADPPKEVIVDWDGAIVTFSASESRRYLISNERGVKSADVARGLVLSGDNVSLRNPARVVLPMVHEPEVGGWVSVDEIDPCQDQLLIVHDQEWGRIKVFLERLLRRTVPAAIRPCGKPLLSGFQAIKLPAADIDVRLFDEAGTPQSMKRIRPHHASRRIELRGGLPLRPGSGQRTYLRGGTPDVDLAAGPGESRRVAAELNGAPTTLVTNGLPLPLAGLADAPREYEFRADGITLHFRMLGEHGSGRLVAPEAGSIGWAVQGGQVAHQAAAIAAPQDAALSGAAVPQGLVYASDAQPPRAASTRLRRICTEGCHTLYLFGSDPGAIQQVDVPVDVVHGKLFKFRPEFVDVTLSFTPLWIVREWISDGASRNARAKPVTLANKPDFPAIAYSKKQVHKWRRELGRLYQASPSAAWWSFVLRSRYKSNA